MKVPPPRRLSFLLWLLVLAAALAFCFIWFNPLSTRFTKAGSLLAVVVMWLGFLFLTWPHRRLRWVLPALTVLAAVFLLLPVRNSSAAALRAGYTAALEKYDGTDYYWGGESRRGIDCSGLIRCGMMNALAHRGLLSADGGLVRQSLLLWWNDTSADALGKEHAGLTRLLFEASSINEADHSRLQPGDLAVTRSGVHILAYLGDGAWTQASPGAGKVITSRVPSEDPWLRQPVKLMRWTVLAGD